MVDALAVDVAASAVIDVTVFLVLVQMLFFSIEAAAVDDGDTAVVSDDDPVVDDVGAVDIVGAVVEVDSSGDVE